MHHRPLTRRVDQAWPTRRAAIALAVVASLVAGGDATAHRSPTSRIHNIRHVAQQAYGPVCGDAMAVPIERVELGAYDALAVWYGTAPPFTGCRILIDDRPWATGYLCRLIAGHEYGHLAGLEHSADPLSIMWPHRLVPWAPCRPLELPATRRRAPARRDASYAPPTTTGRSTP